MTVQLELYHGLVLSPYIFVLIKDDHGKDLKEREKWCMLFEDEIVLMGYDRDRVEERLEQ